MEITIKRKTLADAVNQVAAISKLALAVEDTEADEICIKIRAIPNKGLRVSSAHAEAKLRDDKATSDKGEVLLDYASLKRALSVSGTSFTLTYGEGNASANFQCGRAKGVVPCLSYFDDSVLASRPKSEISIVRFKELMSGIMLKKGEDLNDRTLHFDNKTKTVRGETTDGFRVSLMVVDTGQADFETASLALPPALGEIAMRVAQGQTNIGFDDTHMSVSSSGYSFVLPLSGNPPLDLKDQIEEQIEGETPYAKIVCDKKALLTGLKDIKACTADDDIVSLKVEDGTASFFSETQEVSFETKVTEKSVVCGVDLDYLIESISLFEGDLSIEILRECMVVNAISLEDGVKRHTGICAHTDPVEGEYE